MTASPLTPHDRRNVAVHAECTEPTVSRYLGGERVKPITAQRIERALRELGFGARCRAAGEAAGA